MLRKTIRKFLNKLNYDIVKIDWINPDKFKVTSDKEKTDLFETPLGKFYLPNFLDNDIVSESIKTGKLFDENIINVAKKYLKNGDVALDVGANYGQMSLSLSNIVGKNGRVFSFEAEPFVFDILSSNINKNNQTNITPIFGAVYFENNIELIFPEPNFKKFKTYGSYGLDMKAKEGRKIKTITIDSLNIKEKIGFMKIDVQGADLFAMMGAKETILKNKMPIVFEFEQQFQENFGTNFQDYVDFVQNINYRFSETIDDINFLILPQ
jgi:FkbM family methyltransferase